MDPILLGALIASISATFIEGGMLLWGAIRGVDRAVDRAANKIMTKVDAKITEVSEKFKPADLDAAVEKMTAAAMEKIEAMLFGTDDKNGLIDETIERTMQSPAVRAAAMQLMQAWAAIISQRLAVSRAGQQRGKKHQEEELSWSSLLSMFAPGAQGASALLAGGTPAPASEGDWLAIARDNPEMAHQFIDSLRSSAPAQPTGVKWGT